MAQVVECLPSMHVALSSIPQHTIKRNLRGTDKEDHKFKATISYISNLKPKLAWVT